MHLLSLMIEWKENPQQTILPNSPAKRNSKSKATLQENVKTWVALEANTAIYSVMGDSVLGQLNMKCLHEVGILKGPLSRGWEEIHLPAKRDSQKVGKSFTHSY